LIHSVNQKPSVPSEQEEQMNESYFTYTRRPLSTQYHTNLQLNRFEADLYPEALLDSSKYYTYQPLKEELA
jgi:hypothetical protein